MAGECARLDGNLAVSRGFADYQYKNNEELKPSDQKVSSTPDIYQMSDMQPGDFIIIWCDGVFDVMTNDWLVKFILNEMK